MVVVWPSVWSAETTNPSNSLQELQQKPSRSKSIVIKFKIGQTSREMIHCALDVNEVVRHIIVMQKRITNELQPSIYILQA